MKKTNIYSLIFFILSNLLLTGMCFASIYTKPKQSSLVGHVETAKIHQGDTLASIARKYDVGYYELIEANPNLDPDHLYPGDIMIIPSRYILPNTPHQGIIINLAEMRLYYFPKDENKIYTYPVGIGRKESETPIGVMHIIQKRKKPTWHVPESIRKSRKAEGVILPKVVLPGPQNPLGNYAIRLSKPTYLIHGTNKPAGVGRRSSAGCLRLYPEDIKALFSMIAINTRVQIINQPYLVGKKNGQLYLEAHEPLSDKNNLSDMLEPLIKKAKKHQKILWDEAYAIAREQRGIPLPISK